MQYVVRVTAGLSALALLAACADSPTSPPRLSPEAQHGKVGKTGGNGGTSITVVKRAFGFHEDRTEYDWTLEKRVKAILDDNMLPEPSTTEVEVTPGHVRWVEYEFTATRTPQGTSRVEGVRGKICVTNDGTSATTGLAIVDVVERKLADGRYEEIESAPIDVSANPVLEPGERGCYPYELLFDASSDARYRNTARVTITNHAGYVGTAYGPATGASADFTVPAAVTATEKDATAIVYEALNDACAAIFPSIICTGAEGFRPVRLAGSATFPALSTVDLYNYAVCGEELEFTNRATLVEGGPRESGAPLETSTDSATILVTTGDCPPPAPDPGCTLTQGYWKNHAWPLHPMWKPTTLASWPDINGWKFFDTQLEWPEVLDVSPRGDAYFILAHQYIAAILNQQNGAYVPDEVRAALVAAYDYFRASPEARAAVSRSDIIRWAELLDRYNNGRLGVPHCG